MRGAPTLYERARKARLAKKLSLSWAAANYGETVNFLGALERGEINDRNQERAYLTWLEDRRERKDRTPGGRHKVGRIKRRLKTPSQYRGTPLISGYDHQVHVPSQWTILAVCRVAELAELAAVYDFNNERYGLMSFIMDESAGLKVGDVIPFDAPYDEQSSDFLEAFADGYYPDPDEYSTAARQEKPTEDRLPPTDSAS